MEAKTSAFSVSHFRRRPEHITWLLKAHGICLGALNSSGQAKAGRIVSPTQPCLCHGSFWTPIWDSGCCIFWLFSADYSEGFLLTWKRDCHHHYCFTWQDSKALVEMTEVSIDIQVCREEPKNLGSTSLIQKISTQWFISLLWLQGLCQGSQRIVLHKYSW